ncbi:MAG: response regulator [Planctomycetes bacterium]|nr:response regulator [Planctomycetota bacterium]
MMTRDGHIDSNTEDRPAEVRYDVLVVDDSLVCRKTIERYLRGDEFNVHTASSGTEALSVVESKHPDVILLDVQMPQVDGFEVCRALKADPATRDIPVIFVTGEEATKQKIRGFEAGGADYINKSSDESEVIARVRAHARIGHLQDELRRSRDELAAQLAKTQEHMQKERELAKQVEDQRLQLLQAEKMASIGQLAAGVAHEINNPIGFISSNLNSLQKYARDIERVLRAYDELRCECDHSNPGVATKADEVKRILEEVEIDYVLSDLADLINESIEGAHRVRQIVGDLRDFSHLDSPDLAEEDINQLIDKTINVAWNELKYKTEVVREYGKIPAISCYGGKLGQVFLNLLVNAAQAIEKRGTITVRTGQDHQHIWIEIADTGCGIPAQQLNRIFDPFFTTKEVGKGTGLGLHLAYTIVEAHGGRISAASTVGKGTTFRIQLPLEGAPQPKGRHHELAA